MFSMMMVCFGRCVIIPDDGESLELEKLCLLRTLGHIAVRTVANWVWGGGWLAQAGRGAWGVVLSTTQAVCRLWPGGRHGARRLFCWRAAFERGHCWQAPARAVAPRFVGDRWNAPIAADFVPSRESGRPARRQSDPGHRCRRQCRPALAAGPAQSRILAKIGLAALSGAVAIGSSMFVDALAAAIIGGVAGDVFLVYALVPGAQWRRRCNGAYISVFGVSGLWGLLAVGLFANGA